MTALFTVLVWVQAQNALGSGFGAGNGSDASSEYLFICLPLAHLESITTILSRISSFVATNARKKKKHPDVSSESLPAVLPLTC